MAEYINRAELIENLNKFAPEHYNALINQLITKQPAADVAEICRCKDCLYFEYIVGSYGICEHWHTNSQDIFDLNYCGYAEPRAPKERGGEK